jgi:hypothetical protein
MMRTEIPGALDELLPAEKYLSGRRKGDKAMLALENRVQTNSKAGKQR